MEQLHSCRTAAGAYGYSEAFFRKLILNNVVKYHKLGRSVRFYKTDLDAYFMAKMRGE